VERAAHDHDPTRVSDAERRGRTLADLMQGIGTTVIVIVALLTILDQFVNVAPLLAGVGVLALAFSLGVQGLVKDFIGATATASRTSPQRARRGRFQSHPAMVARRGRRDGRLPRGRGSRVRPAAR
jgi:hypothetical protein